MKTESLLRSLVLAALLFLPCKVFAATDTIVATDGQERLIANMNSDSFVYIVAEPGRSYCCEIYETFNSTIFSSVYAKFARVSSIIGGGGVAQTSVARGKTTPQVVTFLNHPDPESARRCLVVPSTADFYQFEANFGPASLTNNNSDITVRCFETSLYGEFNTSVTDFNFLEIRNISNSSINGKYTARDAISDQVIIDEQSFSVGAGDRIDINIHDVAGPGKFGPIVISHDGPYGSLQAQVSQYNTVSVNPFDFAPVAQEMLRPRD